MGILNVWIAIGIAPLNSEIGSIDIKNTMIGPFNPDWIMRSSMPEDAHIRNI